MKPTLVFASAGCLIAAAVFLSCAAPKGAAHPSALPKLADADQKLLDDYYQRHPKRAEQHRRALQPHAGLRPSRDGNWLMTVTNRDGTTQEVVTDGEQRTRGALLNSLKTFPSKDNQLNLHHSLLSFVSAACRASVAPPANAESLPAEELLRLNRALAKCDSQERETHQTPRVIKDYDETSTYQVGKSDQSKCTHESNGIYSAVLGPEKYFDRAIKNQGRRGSCTAMAISSTMEHAVGSHLGRAADLSAQMLYAHAIQHYMGAETFGDGGDTSDDVKNMQSEHYPITFESVWPFNSSFLREACNGSPPPQNEAKDCTSSDSDGDYYWHSCDYTGSNGKTECCTNSPYCSNTSAQGKKTGSSYSFPEIPKGSGYEIEGWVHLGDLEDDALTLAKVYSDHGYGLVMSFSSVEGLKHPDSTGTDLDNDDGGGGHALHALGYYKNSLFEKVGLDTAPGGGFFIFQNSWGCGYADGGYVAMPASWVYDHMNYVFAIVPKKVGGNNSPTIQITAPKSGDFTPGSLDGAMALSATASDIEDPSEALKITWTAEKDGTTETIGAGATASYAFKLSGPHVVTAKVTDLDGGTAEAHVNVNVVWTAPKIAITQPSSAKAQELAVGHTYRFLGTLSSSQDLQADCSKHLHWKSSKSSDPFPKDGCQVNTKFTTTGDRTITLSGEDSRGVKGKSETLAVKVIGAPTSGYPLVTILTPDDGALLSPDKKVHLSASVTSPSPITSYEWTVSKDGEAPITIGTGATLDWQPNQFHACGGSKLTLKLTVKNKGGSGYSDIPITINYPVC